jgi:hypothetical protein
VPVIEEPTTGVLRLGRRQMLGDVREAWIFTAADGRWHGWITVGTKPNGKPDRRQRNARYRAEVVRKIRELKWVELRGT